jgi:hypothetical protein
MPDARYWRVRMKVAGWHDRSEAAWERGEVGIWYGAWTASDWREARRINPGDPWSASKFFTSPSAALTGTSPLVLKS